MLVRRLISGESPFLISVPHAGTFVPPDIKRRLSAEGLALPDTDWHVDRLYDFAREMGAGILSATHSRYVIDLNRSDEDVDLYPGQVKTGLCPLETFAGKNIYRAGEEPDGIEKANRIAAYWLPYHETLVQELERIKKQFGYAILYDAHSICSRVPRLFDGDLPDLNLGTAHDSSCDPAMSLAAFSAAQGGGYSAVLNGRFVGGHITRHYGRPDQDIHAIQMEISWKNYMSESPPYLYDDEKALKLQTVLKNVISAAMIWGQKNYGKKYGI